MNKEQILELIKCEDGLQEINGVKFSVSHQYNQEWRDEYFFNFEDLTMLSNANGMDKIVEKIMAGNITKTTAKQIIDIPEVGAGVILNYMFKKNHNQAEFTLNLPLAKIVLKCEIEIIEDEVE